MRYNGDTPEEGEHMGVGRPAGASHPADGLSERLGLKVTPEMFAGVDALGRRLGGMSRGAVVRVAIQRMIDAEARRAKADGDA